MKTRPENRLALLKGRVWNGEPAADYLLARLDGEDGEPPWSLREAAKHVTKKLRVKVSEHMLSKWRKREVQLRRDAEAHEALIEASVAALAKQAESGVALGDLVDAQVVLLIAKVYAEEGAEEATKFINSLTAFKRALTADRDSKQGIREYEESTANLRATIERLTQELKVRGYDPAALDALNQQVVGAVDAMILAHGKGK